MQCLVEVTVTEVITLSIIIQAFSALTGKRSPGVARGEEATGWGEGRGGRVEQS